MIRSVSQRLLAGFALLLLTLPALAQPSKQDEPAVEFTDVYQAGTPNAPAASATTQPPTAPQASVKPPASTVVPVDSKANTGAAPARSLPPPNGTNTAESSDSNEGPAREGFYLRLTYGFGAAAFRGQGPNGSASVTGLSSDLGLSIGASLTRGLVLAGTLRSAQTTAQFKGGPFADASITSNGAIVQATNRAAASFSELGALVDWYPKPRYGLHAGLMAGLGTVSIVNLADNSSLRGTKLAGSIWVGYDWSISRYWALGLELLGSGAPEASLKAGRSRVDSGYELAPVALGIAASLVYF